MLTVSFVHKSSKGEYPYANVSAVKALLGKTQLKAGDNVTLKIVNDEGIPADIDFKVANDGKTLLANGWNETLLERPYEQGYGFGVCQVTVKSKTAPASRTLRSTARKVAPTVAPRQTYNGKSLTKKQLQQALKAAGGNKTQAARDVGTNPRTFGRWLDAAGL